MTKELLEEYRGKKEEINELQHKLYHINDNNIVMGNDTILDYRKGYPIPRAVVGIDWNKVSRTEKRYADRIEMLTKECEEVEEFIESIPDSLTRRIFRMYYIDGLPQRKVSKQVHISQSEVSKKMKKCDIINHEEVGTSTPPQTPYECIIREIPDCINSRVFLR